MEDTTMMKASRRRVEVVDSEFRFAHGRRPRGRGLWYLEVRDGRHGSAVELLEVWGSFSAARSAAVARARELGCSWVAVLS